MKSWSCTIIADDLISSFTIKHHDLCQNQVFTERKWWWPFDGLQLLLFITSSLNPATKYCTELQQMHNKLLRKQPTLVNRHGAILFHDNTRPHVLRTTVQKRHQLNYGTLLHSPCSPDLSPTDYQFFKHLTSLRKYSIIEQLWKIAAKNLLLPEIHFIQMV